MKVLVSAARGRTGSAIVQALRMRADAPLVRGMVHRSPGIDLPGVEWQAGDLHDAASVEAAMRGVDAIVHYAPAFDAAEVDIGRRMIDTAGRLGVRRFVHVSVIHPEIAALPNHRAKLAVESHLVDSGLDWTVLRPQHYMQNVEPRAAVESGFVSMPYPVTTTLGQLDQHDLAEAAAKVLCENGHGQATYDLASDEHLSVEKICEIISNVSGRPVQARQVPVERAFERIEARMGSLPEYTASGLKTLFGYYAAHGIKGNSNVLRWLLGRPATSFEAYVRRSLAR